MRKCLCFVVLLLALASCQKGHMVTVTVHGSGSVSPLQVADVPTGESCSFSITPDPGHSLHALLVNGSKDPAVTLTNSATSYLLTNITADVVLGVQFIPTPWIKLTVEPSGIVLPYGDTCTVSWETANLSMVYLNGEPVDTYRNKKVLRLFADTKFTLTGHFGDYTFNDEQEVEVGDWTTSTFGLVSYYPWKYKAQRITRNGVILSTWQLDEEELSWVMYFHQDGRYTVSNLSGVQYWSVPNDGTIIVNGATMKLEVDQQEMIISYEITYWGKPAWLDMVFEHASDTPTDPE
ncbi:MAG: hypothetical protein PHT14_09975 [Petrimonas sp.]|nr:hypothetical protein [Petrimonas sp.]